MKKPLTESERRIVDAVVSRLENILRTNGVLPKRLPEHMTTKQVAKALDCCTKTVLDNWQSWGLRRYGKGKATRYSGASVAAHLRRSE